MINNVYWVGSLNIIGGVETAIYELAKAFKDYDFVVYYSCIPEIQLKRLKKLVKCVKYKGEEIKCKKLFMNYDISIIDNVEADEYIEIVHCVFKHNQLKPHVHDKITKYYAVGKEACESFKEITGKECEVLHNVLEIERPKKILRLISATRIAGDKGKILERMQKLINALELANIPYQWLIFTNNSERIIRNENVIYMNPRLDIRNYIADSDYLVQLSDTEAFCYSVLESLYLNTPVIVTPIPCFEEMGIETGKNGYILNFDMKEIPVLEIYNNIPKFSYQPLKNEWDDMIIKVKSNYEEEKKMKVIVKCIRRAGYDDVELKRHINFNEEFEVEKERADFLVENKAVEIICECVEQPKTEILETEKEVVEETKEIVKEEVKKNKKNKKKKKD